MSGTGRRFAAFPLALVLSVCLVALAGCGGDDGDGGSDGATAPLGVSSVIDGNATCAERVTPAPQGDPSGVTVGVDQLTFAMDPAATGERIESGPREGLYNWETTAALSAERNVLLELDRDQIDQARLLFDPIDRDAGFDDVSSTTRFQACQETDLDEGEKLDKFTVWTGAIITKQPGVCLRGRVFSERNNKSEPIAIPLGEDC